MVLKDRTGKIYELGTEVSAGGEGTVYKIRNNPSQVVKIYHPNTKQEKLNMVEKKLRYMADDKTFEIFYDTGGVRFAWPQELLYDNGRFVGFVMPFVKDTFGFYEIMQETRTNFSKYDYNRSIAIAFNFARIVEYTHSRGYVLGDMNVKNYRFDKNCQVVVLDCDSFDVRDPQTQEHYRCSVGTGDYLAPELQGVNLETSNKTFTKESDYFSLAILIFQILMLNTHPFNAPNDPTQCGYTPSKAVNSTVTDIAQGNCPYVRENCGRLRPPYAPDYTMLPASIRALFAKTFFYTDMTAVKAVKKRATATEFSQALYAFFIRDKKSCTVNKSHLYIDRDGKCPICEANNRLAGILSQLGKSKGNTAQGARQVNLQKTAGNGGQTTTKAPATNKTTAKTTTTTTTKTTATPKTSSFIRRFKSWFG